MNAPSSTETSPREVPYDCLVISDLHLGSEVCQARLLEEFLEWAVTQSRALVINGDIFDDLNFKRLNKRHFACLRVIRRHSDRDDFRLVWVRGNHDGPADIVSHIVGVEILDEYVYSQRPGRAPDPARRPVRHLRHRLRMADRRSPAGSSTSSRNGCPTAPRGGSAASRSVGSATASSIERSGHRLRARQGIPIRDLRPHPSAPDLRGRRRPLPQQRDLDRASPLPVRRRHGRRRPARILAQGRGRA